jgi:hypothetical protein
MDEKEIRVLQAELAGVQYNKLTNLVNIDKLNEQIDRLMVNVEAQNQKESELLQKIKEKKGE